MTNEIIQQAITNLDSVDVDVRAKAIETLGEYEHTPAVPGIIDALTDADPGTVFIGVKALGQIGDQRAVPALLGYLRNDDPWVRAAVAGAMIRIGEPAVDGLTEALRDEDKAVRRAAAKALGKIGESGSGNKVVRQLSGALLDVDKGVRRFAAEALGRIGAEDKVPELRAVLDDHDPEVRIAAFKALATIATPEAQQAVRNWVRD